MLNYSNNFSCSVNDKCSEFIITFRQAHPSIDGAGTIIGSVNDIVSEIVLTRDGAEALCGLISNSLNQGKIVD